MTQYPTLETNGRDQSLFSDTILQVVKNVTIPINVLHVTSMSAFRSDYAPIEVKGSLCILANHECA